MKKGLIFTIVILTVNSVFGQQFTDLYGDYLGQVAPGDTPVVFAPGIVSGKGLEHSAAIFSNDGNEVYWCSVEPPLFQGNVKKIWFMHRINNRWTIPQVIDIFKDSSHIAVDDPFLSFDNKKLYVSSERTKIEKPGINSNEWTRYNNYDIWFIERQGKTWSQPKSISSTINTDISQVQASFNKQGTAYFTSYIEGKEEGIGMFRSKFNNGIYIKPERLPKCINSPSIDWTPNIAPDDSYLIFSSHRQGGMGSGDLYISFHDINTDTWSEPINMGEPINTRAQERFPTVSPDGKYLFFTRYTKNNHMDIFWVSSSIIDKLREKQ